MRAATDVIVLHIDDLFEISEPMADMRGNNCQSWIIVFVVAHQLNHLLRFLESWHHSITEHRGSSRECRLDWPLRCAVGCTAKIARDSVVQTRKPIFINDRCCN